MATKLADAEGGEVDEYLESWDRRLRARNRSEKIIRGYSETVQAEVINVVGKGKRPRSVPYGPKTSSALDRYLRLRKRHPQSHCTALWLGPKGGLTSSGVAQMLRRRCATAGIPQLHPHQFRLPGDRI